VQLWYIVLTSDIYRADQRHILARRFNIINEQIDGMLYGQITCIIQHLKEILIHIKHIDNNTTFKVISRSIDTQKGETVADYLNVTNRMDGLEYIIDDDDNQGFLNVMP